MIWHSSEKEAVLKFFNTNKDTGVSAQDAESQLFLMSDGKKTVDWALLKHIIPPKSKVPFFVMIILSILSIILSIVNNNTLWISAVIVIAVLLINIIWNNHQAYLAEKAYRTAKKSMVATASVLRDGEIISITSDQLVPGDIIYIKEGDYIPADGRLIESNALRCDEYRLTGEVVYVEKDCDTVFEDIAEIQDRKNMVFCGCSVMHGTGTVVVTEVGADTEIGKAKMLDREFNDTENTLKKNISSVYKLSVYIVVIISVTIFLLNVLFSLNSTELDFATFIVNMLSVSAAFCLAAMPETLPSTVKIALGHTVKKLSLKGVIVNKTHAIEKAANVSIICADKTGVLTPEKLKVKAVFDGCDVFDAQYDELSGSALTLLKLAAVCGKDLEKSYINPATQAVINACTQHTGLTAEDITNMYPLLAGIPFDIDRMLITTVNMINGKPFVLVKGAPEKLLPRCNGADTSAVLNVCEDMAKEALSVIAVAYKQIEEIPAIPSPELLESDLSFAGLIGIEDTPTAEIINCTERLEKSGIRTVMLTGDSLTTAKAMARRIGILHDGMKAITGEELAKITDEQLDRDITSYAVFARITPEDKYRIVRALEHNNEVVAITGNSVNDAPYLKKASLGIALNSKATDVARHAAGIIIDNSNIKNISDTIVGAKTAFNKIKNVIHYLLSCNLGELLVMFIGTLIFGHPVLAAVQLLLLNLLTDTLPALSLGLARNNNNLLKRSYEPLKLFTAKSAVNLTAHSVLLCIVTLIAFFAGAKLSIIAGQTMALAVLGLAQIIHILCCYSEGSVFGSKIFKDKFILLTTGVSVIIWMLILLTPINAAFGLTALPAALWKTILILLVIYLVASEGIKLGLHLYEKRKK